MKSIIKSIFSLAIFLSCTNSNSTTKENKMKKPQLAENDSTEKVALGHLFDKINKFTNVSLKDNQLLIGDTSIRLKVNVEFDGQKNGKWIYAANISTIYQPNKVIKVDVGSIGIGTNRDEAINVCIQEWFAVFGIPFTNMLNGDKSLSISNIEVFSGLMGVRGTLPENTWLKGDDEMTKIIIGVLQEQIKNETADIFPIDIKLKIEKNSVSDGECRIDNELSSQVLENLKILDWPFSEEGFIFKQFYLIKKSDK